MNKNSMLKVFIHPGLPKTATTTLQEGLFAQHSQIFGFGYFANDPRMPKVFAAVKNRDSLEYDVEANSALCNSILEGVETKHKAIVASDEFLSATFYPGRAMCDRAVMARRLKDLFGEAEVILTIREQVDLLGSAFSQSLLSYGYQPSLTGTFAAWVEELLQQDCTAILSMFDFQALIKMYDDVFGADKVHVLPYEDFRSNSEAFLTNLCNLIGVDEKEGLECGLDVRKRPRLDRFGLLGHRIRRQGGALARMVGFLRPLVPNALFRLVRRTSYGNTIGKEISDSLKKRVRDRYAAGNAWVAKRTGLDLVSLGYSVELS